MQLGFSQASVGISPIPAPACDFSVKRESENLVLDLHENLQEEGRENQPNAPRTAKMHYNPRKLRLMSTKYRIILGEIGAHHVCVVHPSMILTTVFATVCQQGQPLA